MRPQKEVKTFASVRGKCVRYDKHFYRHRCTRTLPPSTPTHPVDGRAQVNRAADCVDRAKWIDPMPTTCRASSMRAASVSKLRTSFNRSLAVVLSAALLVVTVCAAEPQTEVDTATPETPALDPRVTTTLRSDYFQSSRTLDDQTGFWGAAVQVKALPKLTDTLDVKIEGRVINQNLNGGEAANGRLLEGYAALHFENADLRIGKQVVPWGRADGINPTDNLTPRDFVVLLPFEDDQRFGTTALKLDTYLSPEHTLSVFTTPYFTPSVIPSPKIVGTVVERRPGHTLSSTEVGVKLNKTGGDMDWSVSYFHGYSLLPDATVIGATSAGPTVELSYDRINVIGADFARNFGRFGFRGEAAYFDTADKTGTNPSVKNPYFFWIAGVDRTFLENLNVNFQFFQRIVRAFHAPDDIPDPAQRAIAIQNAIVDGQRDRVSNGVSMRVSDKWRNDTLEAEIFGVVDLTRADRFIRPLVTYAFTDHLKGTVGADLYRGADDTQFGRLRPNRGGFAELRYAF
jgi:hypothetical protein